MALSSLELPQGSWLSDYIALGRGSEVPEVFHLWSGIWAVSCALGRRVECAPEVWRGAGGGYRPNLFVVLVGPSALAKKSTAVLQARSVVTQAQVLDLLPDEVSSSKLIYELGRISALREGASGAFALNEFGSLVNPLSESGGMSLTLLQLYNCPERYEKQTHHAQRDGSPPAILQNVYICMLAATQPSYIAKKLPASTITDGFVNRILWILSGPSARIVPFAGRLFDPTAYGDLCQRLALIHERSVGALHLLGGAEQLWDQWYRARRERSMREPEWVRAYIDREQEFVLKVAGCLAMAREGPPRAILEADLALAAQLVEESELWFRQVMEEVQDDPRIRAQAGILRLLAQGPIRRTELLSWLRRERSIHGGYARAALSDLEDEGAVEITAEGEGRGRKAFVVRRTG